MSPEEYFARWEPILNRLLLLGVVPIGTLLLLIAVLLAVIAYRLKGL